MQLHEVSSFESLLWSILHYVGITLSVVVPALGALWAWSAYRSSKKVGYVLLALFSCTPYLSFALRQVSAHVYREQIAQQAHEESSDVKVVDSEVSIPLYHLVFTIGVFCLARAERKQANQSVQTRPTGRPV